MNFKLHMAQGLILEQMISSLTAGNYLGLAGIVAGFELKFLVNDKNV